MQFYYYDLIFLFKSVSLEFAAQIAGILLLPQQHPGQLLQPLPPDQQHQLLTVEVLQQHRELIEKNNIFNN